MCPAVARRVTLGGASGIAAHAGARDHGAAPVGVFVDENAAVIAERSRAAGLELAQLHGDRARGALPDLPPELRTIFVRHATEEGDIVTAAACDDSAAKQVSHASAELPWLWRGTADEAHDQRDPLSAARVAASMHCTSHV